MSGYYPTCPQCGELCGKLARICSSCGAFLYEPDLTDRQNRDKLFGITLDYRTAARDPLGRWQPREAPPPAIGEDDKP